MKKVTDTSKFLSVPGKANDVASSLPSGAISNNLARKSKVILSLPRIMRNGGLSAAAAMMELWLYGKSKDYRFSVNQNRLCEDGVKRNIVELHVGAVSYTHLTLPTKA